MRKVFKLQNLECANCAAKMEKDINKITDVESASISFMTQKLTIEADTDDFDKLIDQAQNICSRYESGCKIIC